MAETFQLFTSLRHDTNLCSLRGKEGLPVAGWNLAHLSANYMLDYHRDRMLRAAVHWDWSSAVETLQSDAGLERLAQLIELASAGQQSPLMVKVLLNRAGQLSYETFAAPEAFIHNLYPSRLPPPGAGHQDGDPCLEPVYRVVPDTTPTARSEFTHFKTTKRDMYDGARTRFQIQRADKKEVLIVNQEDGSVMEGSITTPYFWRNGRWVTPPVLAKFSWEKGGSGGQDGTTRRWALEQGLVEEEVVSADSLVDGEDCWLSNGVRGFVHGQVYLDDA